jgi:hypothetical protein
MTETPRRDGAAQPTGFTPEEELLFFGPPPLLKGEDPDSYDRLLKAVSDAVEPADIFEGAFVRTIVNLTWEANRYRRLVANTVVAAEQEGLDRLLKHLLYGSNTTPILFEGGDDPECPMASKSESLSRQYVLRRQPAIEEVNKLLASAGLDWEVVKAEAFASRLREIEALNRMIAAAESRMKTTLREIDRHRKGFGQQLRRVIDQLDNRETPRDTGREELKQAA